MLKREKLMAMNCGDTGGRIYLDPKAVVAILPYNDTSCRVFLAANPAAILVYGRVENVREAIELAARGVVF